jgi:hypothetical protein
VRKRVLGRLGAYGDPIVLRQKLPVGLVLARVICLQSSTDATKLERKSCSLSIQDLISRRNGYSRERNRSAWHRYLIEGVGQGSLNSRE